MIALPTVKSFIRMYWIAFLYQFQDYRSERQLEALRLWHTHYTRLWYHPKNGFIISQLHFSGKIRLYFLGNGVQKPHGYIEFTIDDQLTLTDDFCHMDGCYMLKRFNTKIPINYIVNTHLTYNLKIYADLLVNKNTTMRKIYFPHWKGYAGFYYEIRKMLP